MWTYVSESRVVGMFPGFMVSVQLSEGPFVGFSKPNVGITAEIMGDSAQCLQVITPLILLCMTHINLLERRQKSIPLLCVDQFLYFIILNW